jgi:hypothetical protein
MIFTFNINIIFHTTEYFVVYLKNGRIKKETVTTGDNRIIIIYKAIRQMCFLLLKVVP